MRARPSRRRVTVACSHPRSEEVTGHERDLLSACAARSDLPPLAALTFAASGAATVGTGSAPGTSAPIVKIDSGAVRGVAVAGGYAFRGLPYAAPPTGDLRWRAPRPPASWRGVRDATQYAPSCPQTAERVRGARSLLRGLPVPQRLHADGASPRQAAGARVDPRRRLHAGRQPQLRRLEARGGRASSSSRSTTGSARSASSPTRRSPRGPVARPATTA